MDIEQLREYCLSKKEVSEGFPFSNDTLVFKVKEKIFLIASLNQPQLQFNVKCNADKAVELREQYDAIQPGYHMNKKLWNTIIIDGSVPGTLIRQMIDDSYFLVIKSLPKKMQTGLK